MKKSFLTDPNPKVIFPVGLPWFKFYKIFWQDPAIKHLEHLPNGTQYIIIYQKLIGIAVDNNGEVIYKIGKKTFALDDLGISIETGYNIDIVRIGLKILTELELVEKKNGIYCVPYAVKITTKTPGAIATKKWRDNKKKQELLNITRDITRDVSSDMSVITRYIDTISSSSNKLPEGTLTTANEVTTNDNVIKMSDLMDYEKAILREAKWDIETLNDAAKEYEFKNPKSQYDVDNRLIRVKKNFYFMYERTKKKTKIDDFGAYLWNVIVENRKKTSKSCPNGIFLTNIPEQLRE